MILLVFINKHDDLFIVECFTYLWSISQGVNGIFGDFIKPMPQRNTFSYFEDKKELVAVSYIL